MLTVRVQQRTTLKSHTHPRLGNGLLMRLAIAPAVTALLAATLIAACSSTPSGGGQIVTSSAVPQVAPALTVERFLRAANANDLRTMASLFGTVEGPIIDRDPPRDVERRMFAIASVLHHNDFELRGERIVPGRLGQAVELLVNVDTDDRSAIIPFIVVQTETDSWLIEQIDLDPLVSN